VGARKEDLKGLGVSGIKQTSKLLQMQGPSSGWGRKDQLKERKIDKHPKKLGGEGPQNGGEKPTG